MVGLALAGALTACGLAGCSPGATTAEGGVDLAFEQYTLDNGLNVILRKDDRLPIAAVNLWYHVGPANEAQDRTGFAHLFEHLMFQGSGHTGKDRHFAELESVGASSVNGTTSLDRTNYLEDVPSNALETALWLESDRMGFLLDSLDQVELANQQAVVRNERRQTREVPPYAQSDEKAMALLFPADHPYHANIMGSHADIQSATLDEARDFFTRYYVPNNASLAIVGNIDFAATKNLVEKYFGSIPRGADVPQPQVATPQLTAERRETVTDQVQLPRVHMSWITSPAFAPGDAEADLAAHLLGSGNASRLYGSMVRTGIAQDVSAYQQSLKHGSVFQIEATAKPGRTADELEAAIQKELDTLATTPPTPAELDAAKLAIRSSLLFGLEDLGAQADMFNRYDYYVGDPGYLDKDLQRYVDADAAGVSRFVTDQLRSDRRVLVRTVPGPKVIPPEPPAPPQPRAPTAPPQAAPSPPQPPSAEPWRNTVPRPGPVPAIALPSAQRFELGNGLPVYLLESHGLPLVVASLTSRWGSAADPVDKPGLASFATAMLDRGTQTRDAQTLAREIDALGAQFLVNQVDDDGSSVQLQALSPQMGRAMAVMSDAVRSPAFPAAELERVRSEHLVALQQQGESLTTVGEKVTRRELYGPEHPYGHLAKGTAAAVKNITREDVAAFHQKAFTPRNSALVLAGDLTPEQARTLAEESFGSWTGEGADPPVPAAPTPGPERVLVVDKPGSAQTALVLAQTGVARKDPDFEKLLVLNEVLGGGFSSRVNLNLRERNGYSYGAGSSVSGSRGVRSISLRSSVQTQFTGASVREILKEVNGIRDAPISTEELNRARESLSQSLPASFGTGRASAQAVADIYQLDLPPDYFQKLPGVFAAIDAEQVQEVARKHLRPELMKVVAVGDRAKVEPQLAELALGPIGYRAPDGGPARP
ncbi:MAG: M16 family metallopeptidase [Pseudonocardia sp.]